MLAGIDIGGTHVRIAMAHADGRIVRSVRTDTASLPGSEGFVEWAAKTIHRLREGQRMRSIAIGAPGPIDHRAGVLVNPPNLPGWNNTPLVRLLSQAVRAPVHLENDANLAALGEFHRGAGRGSRNMVYLTWSTGIGGGLIVDGRLYSGAHGAAGEVGHMIMDPDGPLDRCGQRGCLEAMAGGHMLEAQTGHPAAAIFRLAARGDPRALKVVSDAARYVGYALINLTNLIDPEVIVIGGGVTRSWSLVRPLLLATVHASPFIKPARRPRLYRARLGDRAGQVGAVEWARLHAPGGSTRHTRGGT
jgi:glucokinase